MATKQKAHRKPGKVVKLHAIDGQHGVHATLARLYRNLEKDFPGAKQVLVVIQSYPDKNHECEWATVTNNLTRAEKLYLLEMGKRVMFGD